MFGRISACLMAISLSASRVIGQSTFGSIVGVVKDPGEGTIADAQITLTNQDDRPQRNISAESNGGFEVSISNIANVATGSMFNIAAFNPIPTGPVGNCGVGILEGPGTATIAAALSKAFHLTERMRMRFESTFTNLFNHPNFAPPPTNVTSSSFGIVQSVQSSENSGNRTGQISLRSTSRPSGLFGRLRVLCVQQDVGQRDPGTRNSETQAIRLEP